MLTQWSEHSPPSILGQLQLTKQFKQPILQFKIQFDIFRSDRPIAGKIIVMHKVYFWKPSRMRELGDYYEMPFSVDQLYAIEQKLSKPQKDLQILMMDPKLTQVMGMEHLRPYLPEKLQQLHLKELHQFNRTKGALAPDGTHAAFSGQDIHLLGLA